MTPRVILLMLTFNHSDCLEKSIKSIISQSYSNFKLIIVDDGSTDDSYNIAKKFEVLDSRISVFKNEHNLGMFENFDQNLLRIANDENFEYFSWLGPDDEWSGTWLESLLNLHVSENFKGLTQSFVTYNFSNRTELRKYMDFSSTKLTLDDSKELRKGYGELMHGLWNRRVVESIIQDSQKIPFKYLLKLENLFISLLIEKEGFLTIKQALHTKHKAIGSRFRYEQNHFFQNPDRIFLTAVKAIPGILRLLMGKRKNRGFIAGAFLIDLRIALPRRVKT